MARLCEYALAKGYAVRSIVQEIGSGPDDSRPKLAKLLTDNTIGTLNIGIQKSFVHVLQEYLEDKTCLDNYIEHKAPLTRFGFQYIETVLAMQNRKIEIALPGDTGDDIMDDFVALITSMTARIYGKRGKRKRAERIRQCIVQAAKDE